MLACVGAVSSGRRNNNYEDQLHAISKLALNIAVIFWLSRVEEVKI